MDSELNKAEELKAKKRNSFPLQATHDSLEKNRDAIHNVKDGMSSVDFKIASIADILGIQEDDLSHLGDEQDFLKIMGFDQGIEPDLGADEFPLLNSYNSQPHTKQSEIDLSEFINDK